VPGHESPSASELPGVNHTCPVLCCAKAGQLSFSDSMYHQENSVNGQSWVTLPCAPFSFSCQFHRAQPGTCRWLKRLKVWHKVRWTRLTTAVVL